MKVLPLLSALPQPPFSQRAGEIKMWQSSKPLEASRFCCVDSSEKIGSSCDEQERKQRVCTPSGKIGLYLQIVAHVLYYPLCLCGPGVIASVIASACRTKIWPLGLLRVLILKVLLIVFAALPHGGLLEIVSSDSLLISTWQNIAICIWQWNVRYIFVFSVLYPWCIQN